MPQGFCAITLATFSGAAAITPNPGAFLEYSYTKFDDFAGRKSHFIGAQMICKW